ncbi:hypothetical protein, partial [Mesorhizobium sp. M1312]|uniref:hypothetical protein n=1 Tax=unclassified Mesorhizobium TaxID=325217 RepID=UPI00333521B1
MKQRPGFTPVGTIVVQHLAFCQIIAFAEPLSPGRVIADAIGRIGHKQVRLHTIQRPLHVGRVGAVAANQPVPAEEPDIAGEGGWLLRRVRDLIRIGQPGRAQAGQCGDLKIVEAGQRQVEAKRGKIAEFEAEQFIVPAG